jgi:hypothetical protein
VQEISFRGGHYRLVVRHVSGIDLTVELVASAAVPAAGEPIGLGLPRESISLLPGGEDRESGAGNR